MDRIKPKYSEKKPSPTLTLSTINHTETGSYFRGKRSATDQPSQGATATTICEDSEEVNALASDRAVKTYISNFVQGQSNSYYVSVICRAK